MKKIILLISFLLVLGFPFTLFAQERDIEGRVRDLQGVLSGAIIKEKGLTSNGTVTDRNGKFKLTLKGTSNMIIVSLIGYTTNELDVKGLNTIDVNMQVSSQDLEEVIVRGFGTVKKITNTGAISTISGQEIRNVPTANVQNALMGRLPGVVSQQRSGQPGRDAADFNIRGVSSLNAEGNRPLIIVDDIEYSYDQLQQININEIESISILKDASTTAIYGIKGANGVLVVTTRRGQLGTPRVNVRVESGLQAPVRTPKFLNSYDAATLINEAYINDGITPIFTQKDLDLFKSGEDPYGHPDINWYEAVFDKTSMQVNSNVDLSGANDILSYFVSAGVFTQDGLVKDFDDPRNEVNTNYFFRRYNFRSNLDLQATKTLKLRFDLSARFGDINQPRLQNAVAEVYDFRKITPFSAPYLNPDGSYAYANSVLNPDQLPTINARLPNGGYSRDKRSDYNALLGADQELGFITEGLRFTARIAYGGIEDYSRGLGRGSEPPSFLYNPQTDTYTIRPGSTSYSLGTYYVTGNTNEYSRNLNLQGFLTYDRTFNDKHHFSSLLLFNQQSFLSKSDAPANFRGSSLRVGYDYKAKYLIDFNGAYNGSDRFAKDKRYGFFPAVSAGWVISQEGFFANRFKNIDLLKIRGSIGILGSDVTFGNRYLYDQVYSPGPGYSFGESEGGAGSIIEGSLGNPNVTWEKSRKSNIGLELNALNSRFTMVVDYFYDIRYDQLINRESIPSIIGIGYSPTNVAKTSNQGIDGNIGYRGKLGGVDVSSNLVFQFIKNKILFQDEATPAFPYLAKTGTQLGQQFGYTSLGFYTQNDIDQLYAGGSVVKDDNGIPVIAIPRYADTPAENERVKPGDMKLKDMNGDGYIDNQDMSAVGKPNLPSTVLGLTIGANWKGLSLNVLFQGSFDYSFSVLGTGIEPFQSQFQPVHQERWTPENSENALFPRLTQKTTTTNSPRAFMSDFWLVDMSYIRLKTVDIGYQLPTRMLPFSLDNVRFYFSGYNLFTWSDFSKYQQDPEASSGSAAGAYLNQRVFNLGLQVGF